METVISLTTIPSRMTLIGETLASLAAQTAPIDRIILWIPKTYRRKEFGSFELPAVPASVEVLRCDYDYGPATKILPTIKLYERTDARLIYCDDDRIYDPDWARRLIAASDETPDQCIAEAGTSVDLIKAKEYLTTRRYRLLRILTLNLHKLWYRRKLRTYERGIGPIDICEGYGGVLVRPSFFTQDVYNIPDILWTVDDVWISGHLAVNGIKIRRISEQVQAGLGPTAKIDGLAQMTYQNHGRKLADLLCVAHYQKNHGIWI